jgi:DNA-binding transcriptional LysR family regulator
VQLDLNLLRALDALLEEGSVGGAADRLHLSAPAMSRALTRVRRVTGDQILVRTGRTMTPTPYALRVREQVHDLIGQAEAVLAPERGIDLATLARTFTVQGHDAIMTVIAPGLLGAVRDRAPRVSVRLLPEAATDTLDLRHGHVDLELGATAPDRPEIRSRELARDRLVLALRPGHPLTEGELTAARYAAAQHVIVSRRGRLRDQVDELLAGRGLARRVLAAVPTATAALYLARHSDLVTLVPERMTGPVIGALGLRTATVPLELAAPPVIAAWHQRYDNDPAHRWLRAAVAGAITAAGFPPAD